MSSAETASQVVADAASEPPDAHFLPDSQDRSYYTAALCPACDVGPTLNCRTGVGGIPRNHLHIERRRAAKQRVRLLDAVCPHETRGHGAPLKGCGAMPSEPCFGDDLIPGEFHSARREQAGRTISRPKPQKPTSAPPRPTVATALMTTGKPPV
jgi:hypothetical protein